MMVVDDGIGGLDTSGSLGCFLAGFEVHSLLQARNPRRYSQTAQRT